MKCENKSVAELKELIIKHLQSKDFFDFIDLGLFLKECATLAEHGNKIEEANRAYQQFQIVLERKKV